MRDIAYGIKLCAFAENELCELHMLCLGCEMLERHCDTRNIIVGQPTESSDRRFNPGNREGLKITELVGITRKRDCSELKFSDGSVFTALNQW